MGIDWAYMVMEVIEILTSAIWIGCFYFTLMYFQHLKNGDDRLIKKSRRGAVICLAIALLSPGILNLLPAFLHI